MNISDASPFELKKTNRITTSLVIVVIIAVSWFGIIDRKSEHYIDHAMVKALVAYGTARAINASVSVLESTTLSFSIGAGVSSQPLQVLRPIGDMADEFSQAVKTSVSSLIIQKVLIEIAASKTFKILLTAIGALLIVAVLLQAHTFATPLFKTFLLLGLARFLFIMILVLNSIASQAFVEDQINKQLISTQAAQNSLNMMNQSSDLTPAEKKKTLNSLEDLKTQRESLTPQIQKLKQKITDDQAAIKAAQEPVTAIESKMSTLAKLNVFDDNKELAAKKEVLDQKTNTLDADSDQLTKLTDELTEINKKIAQANRHLSGQDKSVMDKLSEKAESLTKAVSPEKITEKFQHFVESMLNLATLFIFQTIVMPLIFLYLLLKGFKGIWGVDATTFLREKKKDFDKVISGEHVRGEAK